MNKRAQFFLVAALIIIIILFSIVTVYNSVYSPKSDLPNLQNLADSIKEESVQIIDSGFFNNLPQTNITDNLNNLTLAYSRSNSDLNITYLTYYNGTSSANTFSNNNIYLINSSDIYLDPLKSNITLDLN
ncbi:MAG: hypothetical protein WCK29_03005, partial [archaeon]